MKVDYTYEELAYVRELLGKQVSYKDKPWIWTAFNKTADAHLLAVNKNKAVECLKYEKDILLSQIAKLNEEIEKASE